MTKYLFLFTIGPVQSFISQARKTQDLYTGSFLLSHLINSTTDELKKQLNNPEFIFQNKDIDSKPNRFIAEIESDDVEKLGKDLKSSVENTFKRISISILSKLNLHSPDGFNSQIKDFLQVNWVALPLGKDNYEAIYKELESYLGSIKNVIAFKQLNNDRGEIGRKCSLCGERNVLFYRKTSSERIPVYIQKDAIELKDEYKLTIGEGLCAVCFAKRFYETENFPSTAEIALMNKIPEKDLNKLKGKHLDPQLFFEENLTEDYFKKFGVRLSLEEVKELRKEILDKKNLKSKDLTKYYALIIADGDNMGRWLSGKFLEETEKARLKEFHKNISEKLSSFAQSVKDIIKEPKGKLVYAGGDDVLAFVNLNHLLSVMKKLRSEFPEFEEIINTDCQKMVKDGEKSSISAGVVIAHYKTPLSEALKWARKMEHEAKENGGRDAFAIAVLKRSGEIRKSILKWQYSDSSTIAILEHLLKSLKPEEDSKQADFSSTFIKSLGMEFRRLMDEEGKYTEKEIVKTEIKRLLKRSCTMTGKQDETKDDFKDRKKKAITDLTEKLDTLYINSKSFYNFLSALLVAEFIEREGVI